MVRKLESGQLRLYSRKTEAATGKCMNLGRINSREKAKRPERDVQFVLGPVDTWDHAQRLQDYGSKMGIDATRKWQTEGFTRPWPDEILMDEATKTGVTSLWKTLGL